MTLNPKIVIKDSSLARLRIAIAVLVTMIWATGYVLAFLDRTFQPPPELSGLMLTVVTWLFGSEIKDRIEKARNGGKNGKAGS